MRRKWPINCPLHLTPQYELDIITPQNEAAPRRPISKISIKIFEKRENLNSRIWKIVVQGIHTKNGWAKRSLKRWA